MFSRSRKSLCIVLSLCLVLAAGMALGYLANHVFSEDARFSAYAEKIFRKEVSGSALTFHYSLAHPEKQKIPRPAASLGVIETDTEETQRLCREYEDTLKTFHYSKLSAENRLTLDLLLLHFHTLGSLGDNALLEEVLSPSLGVQAQLPVLLAEYAFYEDRDIGDYLTLLSGIRPYFQSILAFEQKKSAAGLFMSDAALDRILEQCGAFVRDPDSNYMLEIFSKKIADYGKFTEEEQETLNEKHRELVQNQVIPAYRELMAGLEALRGTGKNDYGLARFPGGKEYYQYLIKSETGSYAPAEAIEKRLTRQLAKDCGEISRMLRGRPSLVKKLTGEGGFPDLEPDQALSLLQKYIAEDFPGISDTTYEVRYVHESMEDYLSPAFYLTPPLDTGSPNVIYINNGSHPAGLELFTTLAHEGFPGHLYQTVFFGRQKPCHIRYLLNSSGYVEGWATYIESCAYRYAASLMEDEDAEEIARLAWLNRSVNLCICSLLDMGIHYRGWSRSDAAAFLAAFGIRKAETVQEIYQYIVETPANYLKYYLGYLTFQDLKAAQQKKDGEAFDLKEFHRKVLSIGPVPFPVLEKYLNTDFTTR